MLFYVGSRGKASLRIKDGASVDTSNSAVLGMLTSAEGSMTVTGLGSTFSAAALFIGNDGIGDLTVSDGGRIEIGSGTGTITIGNGAGSTGVLNIGAPAGQVAAGAGSVKAQTIDFGAGDSRLVFNHTDDGYVFSARYQQ